MEKKELLLKLFYEIVNSDPEDILKSTEHLKDDIEELRKDIDALIRKNLAQARIEEGRKLQQMFDNEQETTQEDFSSVSMAARAENDNFSEELSDEEKADLSKLIKIKKDLNDKSRS